MPQKPKLLLFCFSLVVHGRSNRHATKQRIRIEENSERDRSDSANYAPNGNVIPTLDPPVCRVKHGSSDHFAGA
jgi:hypothetical protein